MTTPDDQPSGGSMWKYLWWFIGTAIGFTIVWMVMEAILPGDGSGTSLAFAVLLPFFSAQLASDRFVAHHKRVPNSAEKWWLIVWSFGALMLWSVIGVVVLALIGGFEGTDIGVNGTFVVILAIVTALTFGVLWAAYSFWPKRLLRNHERYAQRQAAKGDLTVDDE